MLIHLTRCTPSLRPVHTIRGRGTYAFTEPAAMLGRMCAASLRASCSTGTTGWLQVLGPYGIFTLGLRQRGNRTGRTCCTGRTGRTE